MFERIVVALDGSAGGERALAPAEELARRLHAPLHLVRVADATWLRFGANEAALEYAALGGALDDEETAAREYLEALAGRLAGHGFSVTAEVRRGFAGRELIAATRPGDLLVMASHGRTGPARLLLGSVAEEVTRKATVPVLLVRATED
jgi:nucleotide-binding universal stress UspA family protein